MKKTISISVLIAAALAVVIICARGVPKETMRKMREKSAERTRHNLSVAIDHAISDVETFAQDTADMIVDGYNEYAPVVKNKTEQVFDTIRENTPDIINSYAEHQADFYSETADRLRKKESTEPAAPDGVTLEGPYRVAWVSDGDTFAIYTAPEALNDNDNRDENGNEYPYTYVRLIGCDTPESVASDEYLEKSGKENTDEGKQASQYTKELMKSTGMKVWLEKDTSETDVYGRLLRYAYIDMEGKLKMLNENLLETGMAKLMTIPPDVRYADNILLTAQQRAIDGRHGFWDGYFIDKED